jgi:hypothetical protein
VIRDGAEARRNALLAILVLSPLFLVFIPKMVLVTLNGLLGPAVSLETMAALLFYLVVEALGLLCFLVCLDNRTFISKDGIKFPLRYVLQTGRRRERPWSDIWRVQFRSYGLHDKSADEIVFRLVDRESITYKLSSLPACEQQTLLLALNTYGSSVPIEPPLGELQLDGVRKHLALPETSYTEIWEHGLNDRFGTTIFCPKEPGDKLRGGTVIIIDQLAYGGLSAVYLVKQGRQEMVLKEFVLPKNADPSYRAKATEMFEREAAILCALDHPQIVKVHDHFIEDGQHYLLLDHIRGLSLRKLVTEQGAREEKRVLSFAQQIAEILAYLHGQNPPLLHRDLTPDNLMLSHDGKLWLIDFGAANTFLGTATGTLVGKQSYIAPEQFRGKAAPRSDLYSLGCTLFFLLTGRDPAPLSVSDLSTVDGSDGIRSEVSAEVAHLVSRLTALDADDRFPDTLSVKAYIDKLMQDRVAGVL